MDEHEKGSPRNCAVQQLWLCTRALNQMVTSLLCQPWDIAATRSCTFTHALTHSDILTLNSHSHMCTLLPTHKHTRSSMTTTLSQPLEALRTSLPTCAQPGLCSPHWKGAPLRLGHPSLTVPLEPPGQRNLGHRRWHVGNVHRPVGHRCQARGRGGQGRLPPASGWDLWAEGVCWPALGCPGSCLKPCSTSPASAPPMTPLPPRARGERGL